MTKTRKSAIQIEVEPHLNDELPKYGTYAGELYVLATPETLRLLKVAPKLLEILESMDKLLTSGIGCHFEPGCAVAGKISNAVSLAKAV
jgi:hypothetical protein